MESSKYSIFVVRSKAGYDPSQPRDESGKWTDGPTGEFDESYFHAYTQSDMQASQLNEHLREGREDEFWDEWAQKMNDSLSHLDPYPGHTFRGIDLYEPEYNELMEKLRNSEEITFKAFLSTSPDPEVVEGFAFQGNKSIIFTLKGKSGRDISKYSVYGSDETEVLFPTGTKWKIGKIFEDVEYPGAGSRRWKYTDVELIEI